MTYGVLCQPLLPHALCFPFDDTSILRKRKLRHVQNARRDGISITAGIVA
ncbi:hypothetical protein [Oscillospiraceae bacterium]|nr:hypothetical protein [Oscillospiraceae bacterium]